MEYMHTVFTTTFQSLEEAETACQAVGREVGFALKRQKKTDYKFQLALKKWPQGWTVTPTRLAEPHNHNFTPATTHSVFRAELLEGQGSYIVTQYNSGLKLSIIAAQIRAKATEIPDLKGI
ncbi:hypothetical protein HIM_12417 [Hirsutella minnesotensis 3608]|uniref:Uncharacterized protein n=1 Tax=Hirsutella minnesotensis 3608 TaxID=1043627 RepID=A0A0F7ZW17_9HYPO|nr:hypothetical protein HIM_12417 [Hirsutella minnesotensis 3608]